MSLLTVSRLGFTYDGCYDPVFSDVSFQVDTDWKLGLTGRNGRGKTTFLQLLLGKYSFTGSISASVLFDYFPFSAADDSQNTIDVAEGITAGFELWELLRELSLLEVDDAVLYRPFCTLSNGEQTKVLLAALFLKENHFLLIDEPTNHLDSKARMIVSDYLKRKKGFILVSHDREFLDNCIDHILVINKTDITVQRGNFSSWRKNKEQEDAFELAKNDKLQKDIKRLSAAAKRTSDWSDKVEKSKHQPLKSGLSADKGYIGRKAAKMMKRSKAIEGRQQSAIAEKSALLHNIERADELKIHPLAPPAKTLCSFEDVSLFYGGRPVCEGISFSLQPGERIALQGKNGSGKSSILKLILGEEIAFTGKMQVCSGLSVSYVSQDTSFLQGDLRAFAEGAGIDESLFKAILRKLDFSREQFDKDMQDFSGGQKKKVLLAKSLSESAHLYIWDEPLNFVDVLSRMQIEELLVTYCPTMLFVEHDSAFVRNAATSVVML